ncbi:MAG: nucleotidyltransferase family protein [Methanosarcinales archaeon]|nr:nucleotidyltransferase family protein [Methanosarcinales archaeon]
MKLQNQNSNREKTDILPEKARRLKQILNQHFPELTGHYNVSYLGVFGSYIRDEQKHGSDLDILVDFNRTPSLFQFIRLENYLSELMGIKVDLVMRDSLKPAIGKRILEEVVSV